MDFNEPRTPSSWLAITGVGLGSLIVLLAALFLCLRFCSSLRGGNDDRGQPVLRVQEYPCPPPPPAHRLLEGPHIGPATLARQMEAVVRDETGDRPRGHQRPVILEHVNPAPTHAQMEAERERRDEEIKKRVAEEKEQQEGELRLLRESANKDRSRASALQHKLHEQNQKHFRIAFESELRTITGQLNTARSVTRGEEWDQRLTLLSLGSQSVLEAIRLVEARHRASIWEARDRMILRKASSSRGLDNRLKAKESAFTSKKPGKQGSRSRSQSALTLSWRSEEARSVRSDEDIFHPADPMPANGWAAWRPEEELLSQSDLMPPGPLPPQSPPQKEPQPAFSPYSQDQANLQPSADDFSGPVNVWDPPPEPARYEQPGLSPTSTYEPHMRNQATPLPDVHYATVGSRGGEQKPHGRHGTTPQRQQGGMPPTVQAVARATPRSPAATRTPMGVPSPNNPTHHNKPQRHHPYPSNPTAGQQVDSHPAPSNYSGQGRPSPHPHAHPQQQPYHHHHHQQQQAQQGRHPHQHPFYNQTPPQHPAPETPGGHLIGRPGGLPPPHLPTPQSHAHGDPGRQATPARATLAPPRLSLPVQGGVASPDGWGGPSPGPAGRDPRGQSENRSYSVGGLEISEDDLATAISVEVDSVGSPAAGVGWGMGPQPARPAPTSASARSRWEAPAAVSAPPANLPSPAYDEDVVEVFVDNDDDEVEVVWEEPSFVSLKRPHLQSSPARGGSPIATLDGPGRPGHYSRIG